ncbi:hypothetical protein TRFO_14069 [Tritrichomonas foetus]|uniref:SP-RING-type domain-containing protein n=1 Tax=Tritrichomonas foetus TaxID=1144522 RepID=A0A1J4KX47_9EUKA|nr:hypothetical protein TRFO_14069 [Tritrichomonas foetus]|eukprot:OHT15456.1 hypothetical protein TRFO_14069 [Tritrichomonas foetus]
MNLINEGIQTTHTDSSTQYRQSQTTQTGFFHSEPEYTETVSLIGTSKSDFKNAISRVDPSVLASVSQSLRLTNPTAIVEFAENLNEEQFQFLLRLLSPIDSSNTSTTQTAISTPTNLTQEQINFYDLGFRFICPDFQSSIVSGPFFVGSQPQHFSQTISAPKRPNQKIIFQSISSTGPFFPPSLTIWCGESLLYSPNFSLNQKFLDFTPILNGRSQKLLEFTIQNESQWYCIVVRAVRKRTYKELIGDALKRRLPPSMQASVCCPVTGKVMKIPSRSTKCQHAQCFELKSAIRSNKPGTDFECPICGEKIEFNDIAVDWDMMGSVANQRVTAAYIELAANDI